MSILTRPILELEAKLQSQVEAKLQSQVNLSFALFKNPKPIGQQKRTNGNQHREVYFLEKKCITSHR